MTAPDYAAGSRRDRGSGGAETVNGCRWRIAEFHRVLKLGCKVEVIGQAMQRVLAPRTQRSIYSSKRSIAAMISSKLLSLFLIGRLVKSI